MVKQSGPGGGAGPKLDSGPGTAVGLGANPKADMRVEFAACPSTDPNSAAEKMTAAKEIDTRAIVGFIE